MSYKNNFVIAICSNRVRSNRKLRVRELSIYRYRVLRVKLLACPELVLIDFASWLHTDADVSSTIKHKINNSSTYRIKLLQMTVVSIPTGKGREIYIVNCLAFFFSVLLLNFFLKISTNVANN